MKLILGMLKKLEAGTICSLHMEVPLQGQCRWDIRSTRRRLFLSLLLSSAVAVRKEPGDR